MMERVEKKRKKKRNWPFVLIFLVGLGIFLYPRISMWYYRTETKSIINIFEGEKKKLTDGEVIRRMELAKAYNSTLNNVISDDPYDDIKIQEGKKGYAKMLEIRENIGHVEIPKIKEDIPMYAGTSEDVLQKGAGHLEGTSLPIGGKNTHTVLTAHTGLPTAKLFTDLEKLEIGDRFFIHNFAETLVYEIDQIKVVDPTVFNDLTIIPNGDYATLLTCTPYMVNSHRLLVRGKRVEISNSELKVETLRVSTEFIEIYFLIAIIIILIITIIVFYFLIRRKSKKEYRDDYGKEKEK